jgi:glucose/mannose-6-phosphate isomerase
MPPRAALGYSFAPLLMFLDKIGLIKNAQQELTMMVEKLKSFRDNYIEDIDLEKNMAKRLAQRIRGKIPIIYGGPTLTDTVALRWKGQLCENSKVLAFNNVFPEFNHNELVGWSEQIKNMSEHLVVIVLRDFDDHPQVKARMDIVKGIIETFEVEVIEIYSRGDMPLERMFSLIQLGDFVSYYLAILSEVDPTPVKVIDFLKKALADKQKAIPPERPAVS